MSDNIDFARNKNLIVALARALEASGAADVSEFITYLEGAAAGFGDAALYDVGTLEGQLAVLGAGGKFDASLLPDSVGAVWGAITGSIANQSDLIAPSGKLLTSLIPDEVLSAMRYRGTWNAATNVRSVEGTAMPTANGSNKGHYYKVSVAGSTNLDGITDWQVGDWVISNGSTYDKIDNTDRVNSVAGLEGAISANALTAALNLFTSTLKGLVPASGGGTANFLRADGTWAAPSAVAGLPQPIPYWATPNFDGQCIIQNPTNVTRTVNLTVYSSATGTPVTINRSTTAAPKAFGNQINALDGTTTANFTWEAKGALLILSGAGYAFGLINFVT